MDVLGGTTRSARSTPSSTGRETGAWRGSFSRARRGSGSRRSGSPVSRPRESAGFACSRLAPPRSRWGLTMPGWGTCSKTHSGTWETSWRPPVVVRSRPRCCSGRRRATPVDFRTLAVAVRSALHLLAERRPILLAVDDVQWLDRAVENRPGVRVAAIAGREHPAAPRPQAWGRHRGPELELALDSELIERRHVGPLSPGALHAILQPRLGRAFARPTLLRLHEAAGGNPFFALELARALGDRRRPDPAAAGPRDAGGARPCSPRRVAGRDAPSVVARLHARPADARTAGR